MRRTSLLSHRVAGRRLCLSFRPEAAPELRDIVELERACCAFLEFDVEDRDTEIVLTITAPPNAKESTSWLFAQFTPHSAQLLTGHSAMRECVPHPAKSR